jgi:hypothetical protein
MRFKKSLLVPLITGALVTGGCGSREAVYQAERPKTSIKFTDPTIMGSIDKYGEDYSLFLGTRWTSTQEKRVRGIDFQSNGQVLYWEYDPGHIEPVELRDEMEKVRPSSIVGYPKQVFREGDRTHILFSEAEINKPMRGARDYNRRLKNLRMIIRPLERGAQFNFNTTDGFGDLCEVSDFKREEIITDKKYEKFVGKKWACENERARVEKWFTHSGEIVAEVIDKKYGEDHVLLEKLEKLEIRNNILTGEISVIKNFKTLHNRIDRAEKFVFIGRNRRDRGGLSVRLSIDGSDLVSYKNDKSGNWIERARYRQVSN